MKIYLQHPCSVLLHAEALCTSLRTLHACMHKSAADVAQPVARHLAVGLLVPPGNLVAIGLLSFPVQLSQGQAASQPPCSRLHLRVAANFAGMSARLYELLGASEMLYPSASKPDLKGKRKGLVGQSLPVSDIQAD